MSIPSRRGLLAAAAVLPLLVAAGCSNASGVDPEQGFASGDGSYTVIPPEKREPAPKLAGKGMDDKQVSIDDHLGKVVVVNVWGSWCSPCRHEAPELVKAAEATKGVAQFIGLNTRDTNQAQAKAFMRVSGITYPNIYDPDGSLLLGFGALPPKAVPSTLIIDKQGRVAARILSEAHASTLEGAVQDIAAGK